MHEDYPKNPPDLDWNSIWIGDAVWAAIVAGERQWGRHPGIELSRLAAEQATLEQHMLARKDDERQSSRCTKRISSYD